MAILTEQDRLLLKQKGLNPDEYEVFDANQELEDVTPAPPVEKPGYPSRIWNAINSPVTSLLPESGRNIARKVLGFNPVTDAIARRWGTPEPIVEGLEKSRADIGEGLLTPLSLGTFGAAGMLKQAPKLAGTLGALFGGQSAYNLTQRPKQFTEAKANNDLVGETEAVVGGLADIGFGALGAHQARRGYVEGFKKPNSVKSSMINEGQNLDTSNQIQPISSEDFYASDVNEPLPIPWMQTTDKGAFTVGDKIVNEKIKVVAPQLLTASQSVKRQFLLDQALGETRGSDTPQYRRFDEGVERSQEIESLVNKAGEGKVNRPSGVNLQGQPIEFGPLEDTFKQPQPLKSAEELALGKPPVRSITYPNETKSSIDVGIENNPVVEPSYKTVIKRPDRQLNVGVQPIERPGVEPAQILNPQEIVKSPEFSKPQDTSNLRKLPVKYQEQYPGQEAAPESNPRIVTREVRERLKSDLGYTDADIDAMSPEWANAINNNGLKNPMIETEARLAKENPPKLKTQAQKFHSGLPIDEIIEQAKKDIKYLRSKWGDFAPTLAKELASLKPFGITADKEGKVPIQSLLARLGNKVSKSEQDMLEGIGFNDYLKDQSKGGKVNVVELNDWLAENAPKVEVKKLVAIPSESPELKRASQIQHELETFGYKNPPGSELFEGIKYGDEKPIWTEATSRPGEAKLALEDRNLLPEKIANLYEEYLDLAYKTRVIRAESNESATSRYSQVNPKSLENMPGAVDILVRLPTDLTRKERLENKLGPNQEGNVVKYQSPHYPNEGKNLIAHVRGYMETKPDGKKVFHIFEAQSDWAQNVRERMEDLKKESPEGYYESNVKEFTSKASDPTIPYYEHLALKAAIKHAIDNGADSVAISDAPTAMLTEMHDQVASAVKPINIEDVAIQMKWYKNLPEKTYGEDWRQGKYVEFQGGIYRVDKPENNFGGGQAREIARELQPYAEGGDYIPQEKGMVQHYDKTLPNIARKLTGKEASEVSFGEHQNVVTPDLTYRDNLVLKNKQGTGPKTDVSAREYDLSGLKERVKSGEPFSTYSTLYANPITQILGKGVEGIAKGASALFKYDPTRPQIDKVADAGPTGKYLAPKLEKFFELRREYQGKLVNSIQTTLLKTLNFGQKNFTLDSPEHQRVLQYLYDKQDGKPTTIVLTPRERSLVDAIRANLKMSADMQNAKGIPVWTSKGPRPKIINPDYFPEIPDLKSLDKISEKQGTAEFYNIRDKWVNYWMNKHGFTKPVALDHWTDFIRSFKSAGESNKASQFGPIDKAVGLGVPPEFRERNLIQAMTRFNNRVADRFAFFDSLESDPISRSAIGINVDVMGNKNPKNLKLPTGEDVDYLGANSKLEPIMREIQGKRSIQDLKVDAANTLLKSVAMQAWSGARDFLATNVLGWQHQLPTQYAGSIIKGWSNISQGLAEGLAKGVIRNDTISYEGLEGGIGNLVTNLQRLRGTVGRIGGRNMFEQITRAVTFEQGKYIAADNVYKLGTKSGRIGEQQRVQFMNDFAKGINWRGKTSLTPDEIQTIAARYTESVQGTYDYRGLPRATQEGAGSYILNWNRWNIEKKNNFMKHVVKPLSEGNYWPLIGTVAGTVVGGEAIIKAQQMVSGGRKEKSPTFKEALTSEDRAGEGMFYRLAALADAAGFMGITSGIAHNLMKWRFGAKPQEMLNYPLVGNFLDNMQLIGHAAEAFEAGEQNVGLNYLSKFLELNIQNARLIINQLGPQKQKDIKHANKVRDYQTFKELSGEHKAYDASTPNPFMGLDTKKFKRAGVEDISKIGNLAGRAINESVRKAQDDPYKISTNLRGLKSNPIIWSPSLEGDPLEFSKYVKYLKDTQGSEAVKKFLVNYQQQKMLNKAKSSMVPSFKP